MSADIAPAAPIADSKPPTTVQAAVVVAWMGSLATAGFTVLTVVFWLWAFRDVFDSFDSGGTSLRTLLISAAIVSVVFAAATSLVAWRLMRAEPWAYGAMLALCGLALVLGVVAYFLIVPAFLAVGALVVGVLLLLPDSRAWRRSLREADGAEG